METAKPGKFSIPIGPQHPALKEPGHFEFTLEGEIVISATARLGYVHRGIEKACENRSWIQNLYLLERICGICSHVHALAYALGVEKLAGVTVPPRAQAIRTLVAELERIHSHLLWLGVAAHEAGFDTLFMYSWRDRETVMDLLEGVCGSRVHYSANTLGGVKCNVTSSHTEAIHRGMDFLEGRTRHYQDVVTHDETFLGRTRGVGSMSLDQALELGAIGTTARASGLARDVRVEAPYAAYPDFPVKIALETSGDLLARFLVRLNELMESYRLIRLIVDHLPEGELQVRVPRRLPEGEAVSRVEAPRGELFYFLRSSGTEKPDRIKVRTPSICNWSSVLVTAVGHKLADMPMLLAGIDPCFSCSDRSVSLRRSEDEAELWSWETLRQYGIEYYR
jgi:NADH-quinone oxidoreductase subunit D